MAPKALLLVGVLGLAVTLAGCSGGSRGVVVLRDDDFDPADQHIANGSRLQFTVANSAEHTHTVTIHKAGDPLTLLLLNETLAAGEDVEFRFEEGGTYHVWCAFHGTMTGGMHMLVKVD